ncbi:MAG: hypothetical protein MK438_07475, partial [SAR324 cluster bacterium]|nr:hypothetical protein [SAR324 cluster bacterium]
VQLMHLRKYLQPGRHIVPIIRTMDGIKMPPLRNEDPHLEGQSSTRVYLELIKLSKNAEFRNFGMGS